MWVMSQELWWAAYVFSSRALTSGCIQCFPLYYFAAFIKYLEPFFFFFFFEIYSSRHWLNTNFYIHVAVLRRVPSIPPFNPKEPTAYTLNLSLGN